MILFLQMFLLEKFSFCMINNLGTPSSELQINFGALQIGTENSATGLETSSLAGLLRVRKETQAPFVWSQFSGQQHHCLHQD